VFHNFNKPVEVLVDVKTEPPMARSVPLGEYATGRTDVAYVHIASDNTPEVVFQSSTVLFGEFAELLLWPTSTTDFPSGENVTLLTDASVVVNAEI